MVDERTLRQQQFGQQDLARRNQQRTQALKEETQKRQEELTKKEVDKTISDIQSGKITSESQIPQSVRQYINIPKDYFQQVQQPQAQPQQNQADDYNRALRMYYGAEKYNYTFINSLPREVRQSAELKASDIKRGEKSFQKGEQALLDRNIGYIPVDTDIRTTLPSGYDTTKSYSASEIASIKTNAQKMGYTPEFVAKIGQTYVNQPATPEQQAQLTAGAKAWEQKQSPFYPIKEVAEKVAEKLYYNPTITNAREGIKNLAREPTPTQQKINTALWGNTGNTLPYGIQEAVDVAQNPYSPESQKIIKGEKFNPFVPQFYIAGNSPVVQKIAKAGGIAVEQGKVSPELLSFAEAITPRLAQASVGVSLGGFFSPLMETGAVAKQIETTTTQETIAQNKFEALAGTIKKLKDKKTLNSQLAYLKDIKTKYVITPEQEAGFNQFVNEMIKQKVITLKYNVASDGSITITNLAGKVLPPKEAEQFIQLLNLQNLKGAGTITGLAGSYQPARIDNVLVSQNTALTSDNQFMTGTKDLSKIPTNLFIGQGERQEPLQRVPTINWAGIESKTNQQTKQPQDNILGLKTNQGTQNKTQERTNQGMRDLLGESTSQISKQRTQQRQQYKTNQQPQPQPQGRLYFKLGQALKKAGKIAREKPELFRTFGKRFGRDVQLFAGTKEQATEKLKGFLKLTLGRSGFVLNPKGEKEELKNLGFEYQPSKREKGRIVQKAEFSLGTYPERKEIQYFRKKKGKKVNWFS